MAVDPVCCFVDDADILRRSARRVAIFLAAEAENCRLLGAEDCGYLRALERSARKLAAGGEAPRGEEATPVGARPRLGLVR